jgi:hypothetical protein
VIRGRGVAAVHESKAGHHESWSMVTDVSGQRARAAKRAGLGGIPGLPTDAEALDALIDDLIVVRIKPALVPTTKRHTREQMAGDSSTRTRASAHSLPAYAHM